MSKIKNDGLDQYGAEPFEQQQFKTANVERVKEGKGMGKKVSRYTPSSTPAYARELSNK